MKKKRFLKRALPSDEMALQITSMADIFTIILVFLPKSYATGTVSITPAKGTMLPEAQASEVSVEALKVEVSESGVQVEGQPATTLSSFHFDPKDVESNRSSKTLNQALSKARERQLTIAKVNSDVKVDSKILVIADQRAPYETIKTVLASAAVNGYTDFKLAVVRGN